MEEVDSEELSVKEQHHADVIVGLKVDTVDGMTKVRCLVIADVKTCSSLAHRVIRRLEERFDHCNEPHMVFDRYDLRTCLYSIYKRYDNS